MLKLKATIGTFHCLLSESAKERCSGLLQQYVCPYYDELRD